MSSEMSALKRALGRRVRSTVPLTRLKEYLSDFTLSILDNFQVSEGIDGSRDMRGAFFSPLLLLPRFLEYQEAGILQFERPAGVCACTCSRAAHSNLLLCVCLCVRLCVCLCACACVRALACVRLCVSPRRITDVLCGRLAHF